MSTARAIALSALFAIGCTDTTDALDGGACVTGDASLDVDPTDSGLLFTAMRPPHAPNPTACTKAQLDDYVQCQANKNTDKCVEFKAGQSGAACSACIESLTTDPTWGVLVFGNQTASFNIEGCVDLALGQVPLECFSDASPPPACSCGQQLHASYECQEQANAQYCNTCLDQDSSTSCNTLVLAQVCATQDDAVQDASGPCAALFAADSGAAICFPDLDASDPTTQEASWLEVVGSFFCGGT